MKLLRIASSSKAPPKYDLNKATACKRSKNVGLNYDREKELHIFLVEYEANLLCIKHKEQEIFDYLNNKLESTSYISITADNNYDVDIADSHVKERATSNLSHGTSSQFFRLHNVHSECIHHVSPK